MAHIRVDQAIPVFDGQPVTFKSPASCTGVEGLKIYYPDGEGTAVATFALADAHGNNVGSIDLFAANVLVKVILDTERGMAYVQNADTNAYLEGRFEALEKAMPTTTEIWTFTLEDGSTVTKAVYVGELPMVTITIAGKGDASKCYVEYNGTKYYTSGTTITAKVGDKIRCHVGSATNKDITLNGSSVASSDYEYTVMGNANIGLKYDSAAAPYDQAKINITEQ